MARVRGFTRRKVIIGGAALAAAAASVVVPAANAASASALDYAQCTNRPDAAACTAWINGILNASNSQYHEDEVTAQRLLVQVKSAGVHSVTLRYMARKGTTHAYDSLASVDTTILDAIDHRCDALPNGATCPSEASTLSTTDVVDDPTDVYPVGSGIDPTTSEHQIPGQVLHVYGAQFTTGPQTGYTDANPPAMTTPTHDNPGSASSVSGDDYATTKISFVTATANAQVQLLFGGHLAPPAFAGGRGWGEGLGASSINGGPYHIKWDAADGASVGNRDNQIMGSAIEPIYNTTLTTVASVTKGTTTTSSTTTTPVSVTVGDTVTLSDAATLTGAGVAPTTAPQFSLWGPYGAADTPTCGLPAGSTETPALTAAAGSSWTGPDSNGAYSSTRTVSSWNPTTIGIYYWYASYAGDGADLPAAETCGAAKEKVVVAPATPTGSSTISVKDTVTVSGYGTPAGRVVFKLWGPYTGTPTCDTATETPVHSWTETLSSGSATTSTAYSIPKDDGTTTTEGLYSWTVDYDNTSDGTTVVDANNSPAQVKACNTENVTVAYP